MDPIVAPLLLIILGLTLLLTLVYLVLTVDAGPVEDEEPTLHTRGHD